MKNKNIMSDLNRKKIVISIAAGVTFVIGFGIGVQYEVTKESNSPKSDRLLPRKASTLPKI